MGVPTADAAQDRTWAGASVPLSAIAEELDRIGRGPRQAEVAEGVPAVARAHVLNFVAYATDDARAREITELVAHLVVRHPSRTIIVIAMPGTTPGLDATISTHTRSSEGRQILYEQVSIAVHGAASESLPSLILPLLLPDLPTYLWWPGDPPVGNPIWRRVVDETDRLILNSAEFRAPLDTLAQFAIFYRSARRFHTFGDLNWTRLAQWRELIAQFFDNQGYRPFLDNIQEASIEYGGGPDGTPGNPCCALLLAGWLASRLGWESTGCQALPATLRFHLQGWPSGRSLTAHLVQRPAAGSPPPALLGVRLVGRAEGRWATFAIALEEDADVAHTSVEMGAASAPEQGLRPSETATGTSRSVRMMAQPLSLLLSRELESAGQDEGFAAALAVAGAMAEQARKAL